MTPTTPLNSVVPQTGNQWTTANAGTFIENVKGPTSAFTDFLQTYPAGTLRTVIATAYSLSTQNVPDLPTGKVWKLDSFTLTKGEPGVHSTAQLVWKAAAGSESGLSSTYQWNMEWQAYTMNLLAFCKNDIHKEHELDKAASYDSEKSYGVYVKSYLDSSNKSQVSGTPYLTYKKQGQGTIWQLNKNESAIAQKIQGGTEFVEYHRPVVTKTTTSPELSAGQQIASVGGFEDIGLNIDVGPVAITDIPFTIEPPVGFSDWTYMKQTDSLAVRINPNSGLSTWTRTEQWAGSLSIDLNLYGSSGAGEISGRWLIGRM